MDARSRFPVLAPRVRLVGSAAAVGGLGGALGVGGLLVTAELGVASRKAFAVGALLLAFGLLGWSGSIVAGDGYEAMQQHLGVGAGWTERRSRRAMARIGGFGAGWMAGASAGTVLLAG